MNRATSLHPSQAQLADFAQGRLDDAEFASVEAHLNHCTACCEWIAAQHDNTLLSLAREVATLDVRSQVATDARADFELPAELRHHARYRLVEPIGVGGMGAVYKAEHRMMHRMVALKVVHPRLVSKPGSVERFQREVRVAARLVHPNIVVSYDADQAGELNFLVMEYVDGESLDQRITRLGPATVEQAADWIRQAALGLQHAHEQGMAHRDIKPQNLMLTEDGQVKILDFGLSRFVADPAQRPADQGADTTAAAGATRADVILGTPDYIAPEQITSSRAADVRADIYSLGCTLYFLLTGQAPFAGQSVPQKLRSHEQAAFPSIRRDRPDVPVRLAEILARMTAKNPADRYATPGEVARDLEAMTRAAEEPTVAINAPVAAVGHRRPANPTRRVALAAVGVLVLSALGLAAAGMLSASSEPRVLVMLPSQQLWYPDYQSLVDAASGAKVRLTFASVVAEPSRTLSTSPQGIAVPDVVVNSQLRAADYDAIVFIGYSTSEFLPGGEAGDATKRLLNEFQLQKKTVASLCAGQRALAQHGALRGKQVAPCISVAPDEVTQEGGRRTQQDVVIDGLVVTASEAKFASEFLEAIRKTRQP